MRRPYIALGLDHQGRQVPTMAYRRLQAEDSAGICDTVPGDLAPAEELQREFLNRTPTYTWAGVVLFAVFAAVARWLWS